MAEREKWLTPANIIAICAAVLGVAGVGFGVAFANPAGQRMLCGLNSFFCDDVAPSEGTLKVSGQVVDIEAWCLDWIAAIASSGSPPPPGVSDHPTTADCPTSYAAVDLDKYVHPITWVGPNAHVIIAAHLSFEHGEALADAPFTVAPLCGWQAPGQDSQVEVSCRLATFDDPPPTYAAVPAPESGPRISTRLVKGEKKYAETWRIVWGEADTAENLRPGRYWVKLNIATSPERVKESEARFYFDVRDLVAPDPGPGGPRPQ